MIAVLLSSCSSPTASPTRTPSPTVRPSPTTAAPPATAAPTATPPPSPTPPAPSPTATPKATSLRVANTDRAGVNIRKEPGTGPAIKAWPEGTVMEVVGEDRTAEGRTWKNVRDPDGNVGWVAADFLLEYRTGGGPVANGTQTGTRQPPPRISPMTLESEAGRILREGGVVFLTPLVFVGLNGSMVVKLEVQVDRYGVNSRPLPAAIKDVLTFLHTYYPDRMVGVTLEDVRTHYLIGAGDWLPNGERAYSICSPPTGVGECPGAGPVSW